MGHLMDRVKAQPQSLHFVPHARGKAFEPGSGRFTTRPEKNDLVKEGVRGLLFVGAGRLERTEVLVMQRR